jgi:L-threonylcarbamoyladenylate synthase
MSRLLAAAEPGAIEEATAALRRGEVIAIPTETVYGLAVLPTDTGIARLIEIKHRSTEKGIQLLVDSLDQVAAIAEVGDAAARLAEEFWPGGLTIVLRRKAGVPLPEEIGGGRPTLGIRLPDHDVPRALARVLGPLAASSANVSGEPDATTAQRVEESLGDDLELILDDGPVRSGVPSTVVDCSDPASPPRVLREGAISAERIAEAVA